MQYIRTVYSKPRRGFTLIELLVVIAIIAILAAILFPVFAQAKIAAKKTQSLSNIKQLMLGVLMYQDNSDDLFPLATNQEKKMVYQYEMTWNASVQGYLKSYQLGMCPGGKVPLSTNNDWTPTAKLEDSGLISAGLRARGGPIVSYALNARFYTKGEDGSATCTRDGGCKWRNEYDGKTALIDGIAGVTAEKGSSDRCKVYSGGDYTSPSLGSSAITRPAEMISIYGQSFWDGAACYGYHGFPRPRFNFSIAPNYNKTDTVGKGLLITAYVDGHASAIPAERFYKISEDTTGNFYTYLYPFK